MLKDQEHFEKVARAARLIDARKAAGFSGPKAVADRFGWNINNYKAHESGRNGFGIADAKKYAKAFTVNLNWLQFGIGHPTDDDPIVLDETTTSDLPSNAVVTGEIAKKGVKIPLYGAAVGGEDGEFELNGNRLDDIFAPPSLSGIREAYGVQVVGDSMNPRYEDGETVYINPRRRPVKGDYVVAEIQREEHGPKLAYIKRLLRHTQAELLLEQFNPPKTLRFDGREVVNVHYVLRSGE
ncbi:MAG TPA: helix-turn-helix transcriptional regulator [Nitrospira sp.]|nr:helix-turn-helix transcriptional regulator [Nitrospira sp.]